MGARIFYYGATGKNDRARENPCADAILVERCVLLALKSELWQSLASHMQTLGEVLLALKSELWQSFVPNRLVWDDCFARIEI